VVNQEPARFKSCICVT